VTNLEKTKIKKNFFQKLELRLSPKIKTCIKIFRPKNIKKNSTHKFILTGELDL